MVETTDEPSFDEGSIERGRRRPLEHTVQRAAVLVVLDPEPAARAIRYDFILCANVLSAVPSHTARSRRLRSLREGLRPRGRLLAVTQYTNSCLSAYASDRRAERFLDGYLIRSSRGTFFFRVIPPASLANMLHVLDAGRVGQAAYALCAPRPRRLSARPAGALRPQVRHSARMHGHDGAARLAPAPTPRAGSDRGGRHGARARAWMEARAPSRRPP